MAECHPVELLSNGDLITGDLTGANILETSRVFLREAYTTKDNEHDKGLATHSRKDESIHRPDWVKLWQLLPHEKCITQGLWQEEFVSKIRDTIIAILTPGATLCIK